MNEKEGIAVYCASSPNLAESYRRAARELGEAIARAGYKLVCGGGRSGLMAEAIEGAVGAGGEAVGVLPSFMIERKWQNPLATEIVVTDSMHSRKATMAAMSRAAVALPGGCGTFEELLEIITWRQLGLFQGHVIIYNVDGYYDPLIEMLRRSVEQHFMNPDHERLWFVASSLEEVMARIAMPVEVRAFSQKIKD